MKFKELITLDIKNLEIYFIEDIPGKLVINNQRNGLFVLTNTLETYLHKIVLLESVKIARIYKKLDDTELLLYCPENFCLIHVNMRTYEHMIIKLEESFKHISLLPLYFWDTNTLVLTTADQFYSIDFARRRVKESPQTVEATASHYLLFYECWKKYRTTPVVNFFLKKMIIAFNENDQIKINFFDPKHHNHKKPMITHPALDVQEVVYNHDTFLFIKRTAIEVVTTKGEHGTLKVEKPYVFYSARFVNDSGYKFVALWHDTSAAKHDQLRSYEIEHKDSKIID